MHFVSIEWPVWMAGTVACFWLTPAAWRHYVLAVITLAFLLLHAPESALLISLLTAGTYALARGSRISGVRATIACVAVLAVLGVYKATVSATPEDLVREVAIPLGLSYYALRCVHYVLESYKGGLPRHDFRDFLLYLFFLPTIVVGPIHRFPAFVKDRRRYRWDARLLSEGLERILYGYVKIAVLANYLVSGAFAGYIGALDPADRALILYLEIIRGGLNLYLQFSGFSDVAIGFARLLGFRVMENFNRPYLQSNISDFWRAWHISLTGWCREYVYTTVFSLSRSPALGALATLLAVGAWHEVSYRYFIWGFYHGLGIILWQQFQRLKIHLPQITNRYMRSAVRAASVIFTVHFVWFGFVIVRQPNLAQVWDIYRTVLFFWV